MADEVACRDWVARRVAKARALKRNSHPISTADEDRILLADEIERMVEVIHCIAQEGEGELSLSACRLLARESLQSAQILDDLRRPLTVESPAVDSDAMTLLRNLREFLKERFELIVVGESVRFRFERSGPEAAVLFHLLERVDTFLSLAEQKVFPVGGDSSRSKAGDVTTFSY